MPVSPGARKTLRVTVKPILSGVRFAVVQALELFVQGSRGVYVVQDPGCIEIKYNRWRQQLPRTGSCRMGVTCRDLKLSSCKLS